MKKNIVYNNDCMETLKQLPNDSIDCIITDPPYGIEYHSGRYKNGNPHKPIENDDTLFIPLDELWRILKPTGAMFVFYSHKVPLIDKRVRNVIIWLKNNWTAGDLYADFGNQYECIAFMPKEQFELKSKRYPNVWKFDRIPADKLKHPTQKPTSIIRRLIQVATNEGDIVLDPFIGSGTTAVACKETNRNYIGCEINPDYCNIANERLTQNTVGNFFPTEDIIAVKKQTATVDNN
jgi:site-specific DNA-methyltransferase (adenine-specific)